MIKKVCKSVLRKNRKIKVESNLKPENNLYQQIKTKIKNIKTILFKTKNLHIEYLPRNTSEHQLGQLRLGEVQLAKNRNNLSPKKLKVECCQNKYNQKKMDLQASQINCHRY